MTNEQLIPCLDCGTANAEYNVDDLTAHIASDHFNMLIYECEKCQHAKFPSEYAVIRHNKETHHLEDFKIVYRYTPDLIEKKIKLTKRVGECIEACFQKNFEIFNQLFPQYGSMIASTSADFQLPATVTPVEVTSSNAVEKLSTDKTTRIKCDLCNETVPDRRNNFVYHANTRHGMFPLFSCKVCKRTYTAISKNDVLKHIGSKHEIPRGMFRRDLLIDNREIYKKQLRDITEQCFPSYKKKTPITSFPVEF